MQDQRLNNRQNAGRQRNTTREQRSPSVMFTVLTIGTVLLLLSITFAADWLRTPDLSITSSAQFLSPNRDNSYDSATINYRLSEESNISARVLNEGGGVVRELVAVQKETSGQHFMVWDGTDATGRQVADGTYRLEISAQGSVRSRSASVNLLVDTLAPSLQLINMQDGSRVGEDVLAIEGITEANATIWVSGLFQAVQVDGSGRFRTEHRLSPGNNRIEVKAIDEAGNTTILSRVIALVNEAPAVLINKPAEGAWINNPLVTVEGTAPAGITLKINNQKVPVAENGSFRYDVLLEEGDQRIQVMAIDDVGNQTTIDRFVRVLTRGPKLELSVADGSTFSDEQLQLSGSTTPGALVLVNQRPLSVGTLGDFQTTFSLLEGENVIQVQARDQAGNTTELTRHVRYEIPAQTSGIERLMRNFETLPAMTIPLVLLLSLGLGFFLYRQNQLSIEMTVDTPNFTPGLPQEGKAVTLRLDLNQPAEVTLEVLDQNGLIQATLLDHRRRTARQHIFQWDGYDDYGRPVVAGNYIIKATAGAPPIKVSSAVQLRIEEDPYVMNQSGQTGQNAQQLSMPMQSTARRKLRQNRKRM